jgi:hypothetical protein
MQLWLVLGIFLVSYGLGYTFGWYDGKRHGEKVLGKFEALAKRLIGEDDKDAS